MALIREIEFDLSRAGGSDAPRHPGLHVSSIIRHLEVTADPRLAAKRQSDADMSEEDLKRMSNFRELGFMWEQVFEKQFAARMIARRNVVAQDPIEKDGIHMTPDAFDIVNWVLEEYKCTWKSSSKVSDLENEFWAWFVQMKAYCYALKTFKARLFVFFVNGNYKGSGPQARWFDIEFKPRELETNWQMILKGRASMPPHPTLLLP